MRDGRACAPQVTLDFWEGPRYEALLGICSFCLCSAVIANVTTPTGADRGEHNCPIGTLAKVRLRERPAPLTPDRLHLS